MKDLGCFSRAAFGNVELLRLCLQTKELPALTGGI